jgi:uncharacterized protein
MPASLRAWYSLRDVETFAAREAVLSGKIKLSDLGRLSELIQAHEDVVTVRLSFEERDAAWHGLQLEYEATVRMVCQRCLEPFDIHLDDRVEFGVVATESLERILPTGIEPLVLDAERFRPIDLIEDELIVSLPLVPRHGETACCFADE